MGGYLVRMEAAYLNSYFTAHYQQKKDLKVAGKSTIFIDGAAMGRPNWRSQMPQQQKKKES